MFGIEETNYTAVLRWKKGEMGALSELDGEVKARLLPHLIMPPLTERDIELDRRLGYAEFSPVQVERIRGSWGARPFLLDLRLAQFDKNIANDGDQFLRFLAASAKRGCSAIPVFDLSTSENRLEVVAKHWIDTGCGVAMRLTWSDLDRPKLASLVHQRMLKVVAKPSECILILDIADADLTASEDFSQTLVNSISRLLELGLWRRIVVEGTNFPEKNPAPENGSVLVTRQEWINWKRVIEIDPDLIGVVVFGDYGADNAVMRYKGGGGPIVHLRYAAYDKWLVARGGRRSEIGDGSIHQVARAIRESKAFAGDYFSAGDEYIADWAANRISAGSATQWRKVNMNHHITRVVTDFGLELSSPVVRSQGRRRALQERLPLE